MRVLPAQKSTGYTSSCGKIRKPTYASIFAQTRQLSLRDNTITLLVLTILISLACSSSAFSKPYLPSIAKKECPRVIVDKRNIQVVKGWVYSEPVKISEPLNPIIQKKSIQDGEKIKRKISIYDFRTPSHLNAEWRACKTQSCGWFFLRSSWHKKASPFNQNDYIQFRFKEVPQAQLYIGRIYYDFLFKSGKDYVSVVPERIKNEKEISALCNALIEINVSQNSPKASDDGGDCVLADGIKIKHKSCITTYKQSYDWMPIRHDGTCPPADLSDTQFPECNSTKSGEEFSIPSWSNGGEKGGHCSSATYACSMKGCDAMLRCCVDKAMTGPSEYSLSKCDIK